MYRYLVFHMKYVIEAGIVVRNKYDFTDLMHCRIVVFRHNYEKRVMARFTIKPVRIYDARCKCVINVHYHILLRKFQLVPPPSFHSRLKLNPRQIERSIYKGAVPKLSNLDFRKMKMQFKKFRVIFRSVN